MPRKSRSDKGKVRVPVGAGGGIRIRELRREEVDLDKLAHAILMLARKQAADGESHNPDSANGEHKPLA